MSGMAVSRDFARVPYTIRIVPFAPLIRDSQSVSQTAPAQPILHKLDLEDALDVLATSGRPPDLSLIEQILDDMPHVVPRDSWCRDPSNHHSRLISAGTCKPSIGGFDHEDETWPDCYGYRALASLVGILSDHNLLEVMWRAIDAMEDLGCRPTNATIKLLLHAIFRSSSRHLSQVLALIDRVGRLFSPFRRDRPRIDNGKIYWPRVYCQSCQGGRDISFQTRVRACTRLHHQETINPNWWNFPCSWKH